MKINIVGHRGIPSLELENTLASIKRAIEFDISAVEIDVRLTKDRQLVLSHDEHLSRVSDSDAKIGDLTYAELQKIPLHNGEIVPLLSEALKELNSREVIIEVKDDNCVIELIEVIDQFPEVDITVTSFKYEQLTEIKKLRPNLRIYLGERTKPFEVIQYAKAMHADGLDLNFWILNPLTYWQARHAHLEIMVYTVNSRFLVRFLHLLYPKVRICSNYPHRFRRRSKASRV